LQYRFFFVPDFSPEESVIILKVHHCLADGISAMAVTSTLTDGGYNVNNFPKLIPQYNSFQWLLLTFLKIITLPYSMVVA
jgi:hypothetical protein